jgi:pimeloyl-ACP methyl ester carboxylesterase
MSIEFPLSSHGLSALLGGAAKREQRRTPFNPALTRILFGRTLLGRVARVAAAVIVGGVLGVLTAEEVAYANADPRGLTYDVGGGRRMRLVCEGQADASRPTVVFEAGAFGFSGDWAYVQNDLTARGVRSCAYDRAGMGLSDPSPEPRDGVNVARDLEKLLAAARIDGPLVLVGHSMAGSRLELFANRNPGRVKGLVYVDTTPSDVMDKPAIKKYVADFAEGTHAAARTAPFGILRLLAVTSLGDKTGLPREESLEKRWQFGSPAFDRVAWLESRNWPLVAEQALKSGKVDPRIPVAVVSAGQVEADEDPLMKSVQPRPALASDRGYVEVVDAATHHSILGARYAPTIVKGVDFVLGAAADKTHAGMRLATVFDGQSEMADTGAQGARD